MPILIALAGLVLAVVAVAFSGLIAVALTIGEHATKPAPRGRVVKRHRRRNREYHITQDEFDSLLWR